MTEPTATAAPGGVRAGARPLLAAALAIVAERGVAAVTVRAVAERANVSPGTVSYHFESADDLLVQALEHGAMQTAEMLEQLALDLQDAGWGRESWIRAFAAALGNHVEQHRESHFACLELQLLAARRPELVPTATKIQLAYARVARMAAVAHGSSEPDDDSIRLTAMITGLLLGELVHRQPGAQERFARMMLGTAPAT